MRSWLGAIAVVAVLLLVPMSAVADATYEWEEWIGIIPSDGMTYDSTFNGSLANASDYTNYNATILPFMNDTGIVGTFTGGFLPPVIGEGSSSTRFEDTFISTICMFKSSWVMSGSSRSWWRVPALNLTNFTAITLSIWRLGNPAALELEYDAVSTLLKPNEASQSSMVFIEGYIPSVGENETFIHQNITAWEQELNMTWLRVDAPIHSDTQYYAQFCITTPADSDPQGQRLLFSQADVGDNGIYMTWLYEGSEELLECDLDISVIHEYGMGHSVSGWETDPKLQPIYNDSLEGIDGQDPDEYNPSWTFSEGGSSVVEIDDAQFSSGSTSMLSSVDGVVSTVWLVNDIPDLVDYSRVKFMFRESNINSGTHLEFYLMEGGSYKAVIYFGSNNGKIRLFYGDGLGGTDTVYVNIAADTWYEIWIDCDFTNNMHRVWVDGVMYPGPNADGRGFGNLYGDLTWTKCDNIRFWGRVSAALARDFWIDDIEIELPLSSSIIFNSHIENGPDDPTDNITFLMPFVFDIDNASNVKVYIATSNHTWSRTFWGAEDGPTDFIIKSFAWTNDWLCQDFEIRLWFQNKTQWFFMHDQNSQFDLTYQGSDPPGLEDKRNMFWTYNATGLPDGKLIWFRPYHALQRTDGAWVNTHIDPVYFLDGRYVPEDSLRMKKDSHSDPVIFNIIRGAAAFVFVMYSIVDKVVFLDSLPDWDIDPDYPYNFPGVTWLMDAGKKILAVGAWFKEVVPMVLKFASMVLTFIVKGITLFISFVIFINLIIVLNSVKRFFVVWAADGPVVGGQYAEHLIKNGYQRFNRNVGAIARAPGRARGSRKRSSGRWGSTKSKFKSWRGRGN